MTPTAARLANPTLGHLVRANAVTIALFVLGALGTAGVYLIGIGRVLERIEVVERAQAATSAKVETIDRETRAAIGRSDRNLARICERLGASCEAPAP